jgi:hypothetical protein
MEYPVTDVIAVSCAIQRINGQFIKKGHDTEERKSNSSYLYKHFCEGIRVDVIDEDRKEASEVIEYLQGLGFKALERNLTDFEKKVLTFVTSGTTDKGSLGIAASLPNVHQNKVRSDTWTDRERQLGFTSKYQGNAQNRCTFVATVEFLKWIPATDSYLVTCSIDDKHLLKFFKPGFGNDVPVVGNTYNIAGYVKPHNKNKFTGFEETMINRVKIDTTAMS